MRNGVVAGLAVLLASAAATIEVRDFAFFAHHENETIAADPLDRATWYAPTTLADDLELQVGLSVFVPVPRER